MTILFVLTGCWIPNSTNTHSEYVTPNAFPPQQCFHEGASMSRYTYFVGLVQLNMQMEVWFSYKFGRFVFRMHFVREWRYCGRSKRFWRREKCLVSVVQTVTVVTGLAELWEGKLEERK